MVVPTRISFGSMLTMRAGEHVRHLALMRAGGDERLMVVQALDKDNILGDGLQRKRGAPEVHCGARALGPPVHHFDAVRKIDDAESQRRLVRGCRALLTEQRQGFQPRQRQSDAGASQEMTSGFLAHFYRLHRVPAFAEFNGASSRPKRVRNCLLATISATSREKGASPPSATILSINKVSDGSAVLPSA